MTVSSRRLSRLVSHALRHEPWLYELELDEEGWVSVEALLTALHEHGAVWAGVNREDLLSMIASSVKQRHEVDGDRIRALYGHSVSGRVRRVEAEPPERLFHGTSPRAWSAIRRDGLRSMGRQYVHLSTDRGTAVQVGQRKSVTPVILAVAARAAKEAGARFWRGNDVVWLADGVPPEHLTVA